LCEAHFALLSIAKPGAISPRTCHRLCIAAVPPCPFRNGYDSSSGSENRQRIERRSCSFFDAQRRSGEQKLETIKAPRLLDRSLEIEIIENVYAHRDQRQPMTIPSRHEGALELGTMGEGRRARCRQPDHSGEAETGRDFGHRRPAGFARARCRAGACRGCTQYPGAHPESRTARFWPSLKPKRRNSSKNAVNSAASRGPPFKKPMR
jgi:hypothetical protein